MKFDMKYTPLTIGDAQTALCLPAEALNRAIERGRIRRSLVVQSPNNREMWYFNSLDLIEFSTFRDIILSKDVCGEPSSILNAARSCCDIAFNRLQLTDDWCIVSDKLVDAFENTMDSYWSLSVRGLSNPSDGQKRQYAKALLELTLRNWQQVFQRVIQLLGDPSRHQFARYTSFV